jgi:hypothetical protein
MTSELLWKACNHCHLCSHSENQQKEEEWERDFRSGKHLSKLGGERGSWESRHVKGLESVVRLCRNY